MTVDARRSGETMGTQVQPPGETAMVRRELWEAIRGTAETEGLSVSVLARRFELDRKTIRRCLQAPQWQPYQRAPREDTLLAEHAAFLTERAPEVRYSAQILYRELTCRRGGASARRLTEPAVSHHHPARVAPGLGVGALLP